MNGEAHGREDADQRRHAGNIVVLRRNELRQQREQEHDQHGICGLQQHRTDVCRAKIMRTHLVFHRGIVSGCCQINGLGLPVLPPEPN